MPTTLLLSHVDPIITTPTTAVAIAAHVWPSTFSRNNNQPSKAAENGAKLCNNKVVAASIRAIEIMNEVDIPATKAPASKFLAKPFVSAVMTRTPERIDNAITAAMRIPIERHKRNSHSEPSPEVQRNNNGLKLNQVPVKNTTSEPFRSFNCTFIGKDCND